MAFDLKESIKQIQETNKLLDEGKSEEAIPKFKLFLDSVIDIGSYSTNNWQHTLTDNIYTLGQKFKQISPAPFIEEVQKRLVTNELNSIEFLHFVKSEIIYHCLSLEETIDEVNKLISNYPFNPEFRQTLTTLLFENKNYEGALQQIDIANKHFKSHNFISSKFNLEYSYLNHLIQIEEYQTALQKLDGIIESKFYRENAIWNNIFVDMRSRVKDLMAFQDKIASIEQKVNIRLNEELEKDRKRVVEILGFFSAIIAFILTTVSIGKNFTFLEAIYFIIAIGIVLILFSVSMSILFNGNNKIVWDSPQIWILIFGLLCLLAFILCSQGVATIFKYV